MSDKPDRLTRHDVYAIAGLGGLAPLLLWRLAFAGQILQGPDAFAYFYPLYGYAADRLLAGELPLWNPHLFLGAPFLANPQAGVFYPIHWLLAALPAPSLVSATLVAHYALAAAGMYLLLRVGLGRSRWAAIAGGLVFSLSGLLGAQAEHVNQVEALAWLPLQVLLLEMGALRSAVPGYRRRWLGLLAGVISGLQLLIGHAQAVYIAHAALLIYGAARPLWGDGGWSTLRLTWGRTLLFVGAAATLGAGLAAVQLGPTLELMRLSVRAGGLDYRQAVSFSLGPRSWLLGLLPHYGAEAPFSEYVAYIGVVGVVLAAVGAWRSGRGGRWLLVLVGSGLFLSLGAYNPIYYALFRIVPGIGLFRVPARWLVVALLGAALLVAEGVDRLEGAGAWWPRPKRAAIVLPGGALALAGLWLVAEPRPEPVTFLGWALALAAVVLAMRLGGRRRQAVLVGLLCAELAFASRALPFNDTTAAQVYAAQRRSTQILLHEGGLGRFLTVSEPVFDSGDMEDVTGALGAELTEEGRRGLLVGAKWQEVLSRNLALAWGLYAVDGYDGGVLPTADFLALQELMVGPQAAAADGRLSEALHEVPGKPLLALAGVEYLISDRLQDVWVEGVYYDLSGGLVSDGGSVLHDIETPVFVADALGIVVRKPEIPPASDTIAARLIVNGSIAVTVGWDHGVLRARDASGVSQPLREVPGRQELLEVVAPISRAPRIVESLTAETSLEEPELVRGLSLINAANGTSVALELDGEMTTLNLGDVRLRRFQETLPRAYFIACESFGSGREEVLARLAEADFDPRQELVLLGEGGGACRDGTWQPVSVLAYKPEGVLLGVETESAGYVVLLDSYYPGWEARVDGAPTEIRRANWFFRAVPVAAGSHLVEYRFRPLALRIGAGISLGTMLILGLGILVSLWQSRSKGPKTDERVDRRGGSGV